jgi:hypothetical protein
MEKMLKIEFEKIKPKPAQFSKELKDYLSLKAKQYNFVDYTIHEIFYLLKHGFSSVPRCGLSGCENLRIFTKQTILTSGCCREHTRKVNNIVKYGVDNVSKLNSVKEKIKKSNLEKYGVEFPMQNENIQNKFKNTSMTVFGFENPSQCASIKEKVENSNLEKYGVRRPIQNLKIRNKIKATNQTKYGCDFIFGSSHLTKKMNEIYGVDHPSQCQQLLNKTQETNLKKYGVIHPMKSTTVFEKNRKNCFRKKEYSWKTGQVSIVQGYEPMVLNDLENSGYQFEDIVTDANNMPVIYYEFEGITSRYYPDIFIPNENIIIEVKSKYTLNVCLNRNNAKFDAVKLLGYNFKLIIK